MVREPYPADSITLARCILDAWTSRDPHRLCFALSQARGLECPRGAAFEVERERRELLEVVGKEMLGTLRSPSPEGYETYSLCLDLLRNLVLSNS